MRHSGFVLAYHGCDRSIGESVLAGKQEIRTSRNEYDWLGSGAYFWENSPTRARQWAQFLRKNPIAGTGKIRNPFVVGAIIDPGNCLDLSEAGSLDVLRAGYTEYNAMMRVSGTPLPQNSGGYRGDIDLVKVSSIAQS
jgi:hypothetical protein